MGMLFHVQSSKFGPSYLQSRIENFLEGVPEILVCIPSCIHYDFRYLCSLLDKLWFSITVNLFCASDFLFSFPILKDGFDEESFKQHKDALIAEKLEKDPSLSSEADVYWYQIVDKRYVYCSLTWCF